jgi:hypothetical protein
LKIFLKIFIIGSFIICLSSCGKSEKIYKGVVQGMYEGANQSQEMKRDYPIPPVVGKEPFSYGQYEQDRREMIKDKNN